MRFLNALLPETTFHIMKWDVGCHFLRPAFFDLIKFSCMYKINVSLPHLPSVLIVSMYVPLSFSYISNPSQRKYLHNISSGKPCSRRTSTAAKNLTIFTTSSSMILHLQFYWRRYIVSPDYFQFLFLNGGLFLLVPWPGTFILWPWCDV